MDIVDRLSPRGFDCVCGNLRMAARAVSGVYDRHLAAAGIQSSQLAVLWAVSAAHGITVKEIAERIAMHETTLIRNLRVLEREGWVSLRVGDADRRQRIASLTRRGRAVFAKSLPLWRDAQAEVERALDEKLPLANRKLVRLARAVWLAALAVLALQMLPMSGIGERLAGIEAILRPSLPALSRADRSTRDGDVGDVYWRVRTPRR